MWNPSFPIFLIKDLFAATRAASNASEVIFCFSKQIKWTTAGN